uniref:Uncharacterized protein n=1 Tax=Arundo donax TaxID=35708 RepID=A0A0A9AG81_ARUDO
MRCRRSIGCVCESRRCALVRVPKVSRRPEIYAYVAGSGRTRDVKCLCLCWDLGAVRF